MASSWRPSRECQPTFRVGVDHAILQQVQREQANFVIFSAIAREFAALREKDKVVRPIPLLYDNDRAVRRETSGTLPRIESYSSAFQSATVFAPNAEGALLRSNGRTARSSVPEPFGDAIDTSSARVLIRNRPRPCS